MVLGESSIWMLKTLRMRTVFRGGITGSVRYWILPRWGRKMMHRKKEEHYWMAWVSEEQIFVGRVQRPVPVQWWETRRTISSPPDLQVGKMQEKKQSPSETTQGEPSFNQRKEVKQEKPEMIRMRFLVTIADAGYTRAVAYAFGTVYFQGCIWKCLETFLVVITEGYYQHLVSRGQGCCQTWTELSFVTKSYPTQKVNSVRNPGLRHPRTEDEWNQRGWTSSWENARTLRHLAVTEANQWVAWWVLIASGMGMQNHICCWSWICLSNAMAAPQGICT